MMATGDEVDLADDHLGVDLAGSRSLRLGETVGTSTGRATTTELRRLTWIPLMSRR